MCSKLGVDREKYKETLEVESMKDLSMSRASKIIEALTLKEKQMQNQGVTDIPTVSYDEEDASSEIPE